MDDKTIHISVVMNWVFVNVSFSFLNKHWSKMFEKPKTLYILFFLSSLHYKRQEKWSLWKNNCSICKIKTYRKLELCLFFLFQGTKMFCYPKKAANIRKCFFFFYFNGTFLSRKEKFSQQLTQNKVSEIISSFCGDIIGLCKHAGDPDITTQIEMIGDDVF